MELDDLKGAWAQYDEKLTAILSLNEQLLRKMNLNESKRELQKPLMYELSNVVGMLVLVSVTVGMSIRVIDEPRFSIPGFIAALAEVPFLVFAVIKANKFLRLDHYATSVVKLQREVESLNELVLRFRRMEVILSPFVIVPALPLIFKIIHKVDLYENVMTFWMALTLILVVCIPLTVLLNKYLYDKKFQNSKRLLREIEKYEDER